MPEPQTLATAIRIGDPVSWPKALHEVTASNGVVEKVSEQEIADAKAIIGRCGIGCEPASAATLAGIRKLTRARSDSRGRRCDCSSDGKCSEGSGLHLSLSHRQLKDPEGKPIEARFGNQPVVVPNDADAIAKILEG